MKRLFLVGLVLCGVLAACGGGGNGSGGGVTPPAEGSSTATPTPSPTPSPTPVVSGSSQVGVSAGSTPTLTLAALAGYGGTVGFSAASTSATITVADQLASAGAPSGVVALQGELRKAPQLWSQATTQSGSTNTPLVYLTLSTSASVSFGASPSLTFTLPSPPPSGPFYLAAFAGGQWQTVAGPVNASGTTVTFLSTTGTLALTSGTNFYLAFYTGGVIATPTPSPSPTPTASPTATPPASASPSPTPVSAYPCNDAGFLADQAGFANGSIPTTNNQPVDVCGNVTSVLAEKHTSSGNHGYFYVEMPGGYLIEIVSNLDAMGEASNPPPATWPWVTTGDYVTVRGRYYYDNASSQGIDWTEGDTSASWPQAGYVVDNGNFYN